MPALNHVGLSHAEVGKRLGISAVRVRQIELRALLKLRQRLEQIGVTSADVRRVFS